MPKVISSGRAFRESVCRNSSLMSCSSLGVGSLLSSF